MNNFAEKNLRNADELAATLNELPEDKQGIVVMMANSFIAGMQAQARLVASSTPANA